MSKPSKIALGIISVIPLAYIFVFVGFMFLMVLSFAGRTTAGSAAQNPDGPPRLFLAIFVVHFLMILLSFALTAFYMVYLFRTSRIEQSRKALWAVVLFLGNMGAFPVFWYLYIWREPENVSAA